MPRQVFICLTGKGEFICKLHCIAKYIVANFMACAFNRCVVVVIENTNDISRHMWI